MVLIADQFKLSNTLEAIQKYEAEEQNYRKKLLSAEFAEELRKENKFLRHNPTVKGTIVLRLRWPSITPCTVSEFENIVKDVFPELFHYVHLLKVESGSVVMTMCAPQHVTATLVVMAKRRTYLKDIGVTWLTIGDERIIEVIQLYVSHR